MSAQHLLQTPASKSLFIPKSHPEGPSTHRSDTLAPKEPYGIGGPLSDYNRSATIWGLSVGPPGVPLSFGSPAYVSTHWVHVAILWSICLKVVPIVLTFGLIGVLDTYLDPLGRLNHWPPPGPEGLPRPPPSTGPLSP